MSLQADMVHPPMEKCLARGVRTDWRWPQGTTEETASLRHLRWCWSSQPGLPGAGLPTRLRTGQLLSWSEVIRTPRPQSCRFLTPSGIWPACACSAWNRSMFSWSPASSTRRNFLRIGRLKTLFPGEKRNVITQSSAICV